MKDKDTELFWKPIWHVIYLADESLWYLYELHPLNGIQAELFYHTVWELNEGIFELGLPDVIYDAYNKPRNK